VSHGFEKAVLRQWSVPRVRVLHLRVPEETLAFRENAAEESSRRGMNLVFKRRDAVLGRRYASFLKTLAHYKRFAIIQLLLIKGPESVSQVVYGTGFDQATVSRNLRILAKCQYVFSEKRGKQRIYSLNQETIVPLLKLIDEHAKRYCPGCL